MDLIHTGVELGIGSIIEAVGPPSANWLCADGQILDQANYSQYVAGCNTLHPRRYENIQYMNERTEPPYSCVRKGNIIVVVGKGTEVLYTTDGGQNWTVNTPLGGSSSDYYYAVACDGTTFVTCRYNSNEAYTSTDGINWTLRTMSQSGLWKDVIWTGNYFMAIAYISSSRTLDYSANGTSGWTGASFPDNYTDVDYAAHGGNAYIYYSTNDDKWHKTVDGGQNWTTSTNMMEWFSPSYEGMTPDMVGYDGTNFVLWYNGYNENLFLISSDGFTWEWIPFTQSLYDYQEFSPSLIHYDGSDDIFVMQSYSHLYPTWYVCNGSLEIFERRISQVIFDITSNEAKSKVAVIPGTGMLLVGFDGVKNREIWADFTYYDSATEFQLPTLSNGLPGGLKKYIRMN
jgi:hypothetical protein